MHALWAIVVALVVSLVGISWFGYPYLKEHRALLGELPMLQNGLQAVGYRVNAAEEKLDVRATEGTGLKNRLGELQQSVSSNLRSVRSQTQLFTTQMGQRLKADLAQSLQAMQNRLTSVESTQGESAEHLAEVDKNLTNLRQEMATLREQTAEQAAQLSVAQQHATNEFSDVNRRLDSHTTKLADVADHLNRERKEFEISKNRTEQIAPSIYLTIKRADVEQQQVDGWLQLANEGRIVWIHAHGAQNTLSFVTRQEQRAQELVFTRVSKNGVAGYLLVPAPVSNATLNSN
jgi:chromosome segregation ATPase